MWLQKPAQLWLSSAFQTLRAESHFYETADGLIKLDKHNPTPDSSFFSPHKYHCWKLEFPIGTASTNRKNTNRPDSAW